MGPLGLKARSGIWKKIAVINLELVTRTRAARGGPGKVSMRVWGERVSFVIRYHRQFLCLRRPNAEMRFVFANDFRSYGVTTLHSAGFSPGIQAMAVRDFASPPRRVRFK